jgi:PilZ domain
MVTKEKRRTPRYPFVASAELIEVESQTQLSTRVSELSLHGCYFDTISPFPEGTSILLKIVRGLVFFEAQGLVAYSQPNLGMGVEFQRIHPYFLKVLQGWLIEAETTEKTNRTQLSR